jgi:hypothetical protein
VLAAVRRGHGEGRGEHLQWWAPLVSVSFAMQQSASGPMDSQQTDSKGKEDSRGETEGRERQEGILSLLSRRLILSCSSGPNLPPPFVCCNWATQNRKCVFREFCCFAQFGPWAFSYYWVARLLRGLCCSCFLVSVRLFFAHTMRGLIILSVQSSYGLFVSLCHFRDNSCCIIFHFPYFFN